jgi:probable HAF family extracellular repeat protein
MCKGLLSQPQVLCTAFRFAVLAPFLGCSPIDTTAPDRTAITVTELGTLPFHKGPVLPADINERGHVVGTIGEVDEPPGATSHAVVWANGLVRDLGTLGSDYTSSSASAINDQGQIIGTSLRPAGFEDGQRVYDVSCFIWEDGIMRDLGHLGSKATTARDQCDAVAINNRGQIVGSSLAESGDRHAFLWENGAMRDLGTLAPGVSQAVDINDAGQVVGTSDEVRVIHEHAWSTRSHAFLWEGGIMRDLGTLGGGDMDRSSPSDINERGQVVGTSTTDPQTVEEHAFLWENGVMRDLGTPGEQFSSWAVAINDSGEVVGVLSAYPWGGRRDAFLWADGVLHDLGGLVDPFHDSKAVAINERGQVVGTSADAAIMWEGDTWHVLPPPEWSMRK